MSDDLYSILTRGSGNIVTSVLEIERDGEVEVETPDSDEIWYTNADSTLLYNEELEDNELIGKKTYQLIPGSDNLYSLIHEEYITRTGTIVSSEGQRFRYSDDDDSLTGQSNVNIALMGGNDTCEITDGSDNFANGNNGQDSLTINGGFGRYLGGGGADTITVNAAGAGTQVNGNKGRDLVTGGADGVIFRGGSEPDTMRVSSGRVFGDRDSDVFEAVAGQGIAMIEDYNSLEDSVRITISGGTWTVTDSGLQFGTPDDPMLTLIGQFSLEAINITS